MDAALAALHLYPSALARDAALDALPAAAWTGRHLAFAEFIAELERLLPPDAGGRDAHTANVVGGAARHALLLAALREATKRKTDSRLRNSAEAGASLAERESLGSDAALQAAGRLLAAWKGAGLGPENVAAAAQRLTRACGAKATLAFLARLYAAYERLLVSARKRTAWTDREGAEQALLARLERSAAFPARLLPAAAPLHVHGFHRLVTFQRRVLERAAALGHPVHLETPVPVAPESTFAATFGALRGSLIPAPSGLPKEHLRIEAPSPYSEVYEIGRRIRGWIVDEHVAPPAICLAFRDLGAYSQAVSDVFRRFGIPYHERRGEPAIFQPLVRVALSAIDACVNGLGRSDLFRFLCSGVVDVAALAGHAGDAVDPEDLHALALDAHIDRFFGDEARAPASAWADRLQRYAARHGARSAHAAVLRGVTAKLSGLCVQRTAKAHAAAWAKLFADAGLSRGALLDRRGTRWHDLHKDRLALEALAYALEAAAEGPLADSTPLPLEEFSRLLNTEILEHSVRAEGAARGGVQVLSLYDLRGLRFEKLIVAGMAEGSFPAMQPPDPLLGRGGESEIRQALGAMLGGPEALLHSEPRLPDENRAEEEALFRIACAAASGAELVFTRPRLNAERRPVGASLFWDRVLPQCPTSDDQAAPINPAPPLKHCLMPEEAELRAAFILGGGRPKEQADEQSSAAAWYKQSPRLQALARTAALERRRQHFFQAQAAESAASGEETPPAVARAGAYDGIVASAAPEARARLAELLLVPRSPTPAPAMLRLSPSGLETLAACPFYFLADKVLRFKQPGEPGEELSPLDRGSIWHTVLAEFYSGQLGAARAAGRVVACLERKRKDEYLRLLRTIAEKVLQQAPHERFVGHPGLWSLRRGQIESSVERWLEHELRLCEQTEFYPVTVELPFGPEASAQAPAVAIPMDAPGAALCLPLEGRVDRVDLRLDDANAATPLVTAVRVVDYKAGRAEQHKEDVKEETLQKLLAVQLPVYVRAAVRFVEGLAEQGRVRIDAQRLWAESEAAYYCLRGIPGKLRGGKFNLLPISKWPEGSLRGFLAPENESAAGSLFELVRRKVQAVLQGEFPVWPPKCHGTNCPARFVCRYQNVPSEEGVGSKTGGGA